MNKNTIIQDVIKKYPGIMDYIGLKTRLAAVKAAPMSRDQLERLLARKIAAVERKYLLILEEHNGVVPFNFWQDYEAELRREIASPLRAQIEQSFSNYSDYVDFIDKAGAVGDIDTAMTQAIDKVARSVADNSRLNLDKLIREGISPEELIERMSIRLSSGHAEQIAVTELTRADAFYSEALSARLGEQGVTTQIRWLSSEDERQCPICAEADHKLKDQPINTTRGGWNGQTWGQRYGGPPAHTACRCTSVVEITTRRPQ